MNPVSDMQWDRCVHKKRTKIRISLQAAVIIAVISLLCTDLYAIRSRTDYFLKPQAGLWFGPITPVYTTADDLETDIGAGIFMRYNTPLRELRLE